MAPGNHLQAMIDTLTLDHVQATPLVNADILHNTESPIMLRSDQIAKKERVSMGIVTHQFEVFAGHIRQRDRAVDVVATFMDICSIAY